MSKKIKQKEKHDCSNCRFLHPTFSSEICTINAFDFCLDSSIKTDKAHFWRRKDD
jgi:hypothetical protein